MMLRYSRKQALRTIDKKQESAIIVIIIIVAVTGRN